MRGSSPRRCSRCSPGWGPPIDPRLTVDQLVGGFDLSRFGRAPARFDEAELHRINAAIVHRLPFARVAHLLPQGMGETAWEAIRPNLAHIDEAAEWWQVVTGPVTASEPDTTDAQYLAEAAIALATLDWTSDPWHALTTELKNSTGRKGKLLFLPLRRALTGRDHGPDMAALLPLIGRDRAVARFEAGARSALQSQ
jgi:glutamyl-tRNA synthetase